MMASFDTVSPNDSGWKRAGVRIIFVIYLSMLLGWQASNKGIHVRFCREEDDRGSYQPLHCLLCFRYSFNLVSEMHNNEAVYSRGDRKELF